MLDIISFLTGGSNRIVLKRHEYIRAGLWLLGIFLVIVIYALEVKYFNNTFGVGSLVRRAVVVGALLGVVLGFLLTRNKPDMELLLKFQLWVAVIIGCIVIMPLLASLSNRLLSFQPAQPIPVELVRVEGFYANRFGLPEGQAPSADGYYVFFIKDNQLERLKYAAHPFPGAQAGEVVDIPVKTGLWNYDFVPI